MPQKQVQGPERMPVEERESRGWEEVLEEMEALTSNPSRVLGDYFSDSLSCAQEEATPFCLALPTAEPPHPSSIQNSAMVWFSHIIG